MTSLSGSDMVDYCSNACLPIPKEKTIYSWIEHRYKHIAMMISECGMKELYDNPNADLTLFLFVGWDLCYNFSDVLLYHTLPKSIAYGDLRYAQYETRLDGNYIFFVPPNTILNPYTMCQTEILRGNIQVLNGIIYIIGSPLK